MEFAGIVHLQQVNVLAPHGKVCVEKRRAVVVKFLARKEVGPPIRLVVDGVEPALRQELRARRDRIFGQQVFPARPAQREPHCYDIAHVHRAIEWNQVVSNRIGRLVLPLLQQVIVARDVERELALLEVLAVCRVPTVFR